jgi:hypothetical protein
MHMKQLSLHTRRAGLRFIVKRARGVLYVRVCVCAGACMCIHRFVSVCVIFVTDPP